MPRIILILAATLSLAACNTIQGAGEDLENAGEGVQTMAEEAEDDIAG